MKNHMKVIFIYHTRYKVFRKTDVYIKDYDGSKYLTFSEHCYVA